MSDKRGSNPFRNWHDMSGREQAVRSASYATPVDNEASASSKALAADRVVTLLRALDLDSYPYEPEHELWRAGLNIEFEEFAPWYQIALRMTRVGRSDVNPYKKATEEECKDAFHRYLRSKADFS